MKKKGKIPQKQQIINHFKNRNTITSWEAISKYRITRLAAIINRLVINDGWDIKGQWHYNEDGEQDFYIYTNRKK